MIGGWQKFSLADYPGHSSAVLFTQGCNFRCPFCHNPELVIPERFREPITEQQVLEFLNRRRGQLEAVTITGGEPLIHSELPDLMKKIKQMGFLLKLDTNGGYPRALEKILDQDLADYLAMDIKAPFDKYQHLVGTSYSAQDLCRSVELIKSSGLEYEFRTTVIKSKITEDDLHRIAGHIWGADKYYLQSFRPGGKILDPAWRNEQSYSKQELEEIADRLLNYVKECLVR